MAQSVAGFDPTLLDWPMVAKAKRWLRQGWDIHEVAVALGVRVRDLDVSLWRNLGGEGWVS